MKKLILISSLLISVMATASPEHKPAAMPKEFETLKKLIGTWEGTTKMGDKEETVKVVYELTSGGTAITEKLMQGTPQEMTSVYHKDNKSIAMTHYCALGNQPHLKLKKQTDNMVSFEMTKPQGIGSMKEPHMHAMTMTFDGADKLKHEWVSYEGGKKKDTVVFTLTRKN